MTEYWPWVAMATGLIVLFVYRFASAPKTLQREQVEQELRDIAQQVGGLDDRAIDQYVRLRSRGARLSSKVRATREFMPIVISLVVLLSAVFVILSGRGYPDAQQKWAFGVVGTILGYWLKR